MAFSIAVFDVSLCVVCLQLSSMWLKDEFQEHVVALSNEVRFLLSITSHIFVDLS